MAKKYWLIKSEPECYSIDNLKRDKMVSWTGVRNYQARNFIRDMQIGDQVLFYHSGNKPAPAVVGVCIVVSAPTADITAQDKNDEHFDPKATEINPIWTSIDMQYISTLTEPVTLSQIKINPKLSGMSVAKPGNRLSVQPLSLTHFKEITKNHQTSLNIESIICG